MLDDPWQDGAIPIRFYEEDASIGAILAAAERQPIDGIIALGDRPTTLAARVAAHLGLPGHPFEAVATARDKARSRQTWRDAGLPVPWFLPVRLADDPLALITRLSFPCVVKPVVLAASRGVIRADTPEEFMAAFERLREIVRLPELRAEREVGHERALVEGFIPGREFALEALLHHGTLHVLAVFDKPDPLDGPFFEETIYVTPSCLDREVQEKVVETVARAAAAIGLRHGPIHAECRVNRAGVFVLEVAARPIGGLCARALRFEERRTPFSGSRTEIGVRPPFSFEALLLRHAVGESPEGWSRESCASGVMMIPIPSHGLYRGVSGEDEARSVPGVEEIVMTAKADQMLVPWPEGASYLGFIFARATSNPLVEHALRDAHGRLHFSIQPSLPVKSGP
jgi:hypothetical protein